MFDTIAVDFRRMFPVFPLPETVLLPHGIQPLHIFEPRYIQMFEALLDGRGQIAMATWADLSPEVMEHRPLRQVVCMGQIVQHERVQSGYQVLLHGLCRGRIVDVQEPTSDRMFRTALIRPISGNQPSANDGGLNSARGEIRSLLRSQSLKPMERLETVATWFDLDEVPTGPLVDLAAAAVLGSSDQRYELLAEPNAGVRAKMVLRELRELERLLRLAALQPREQGGRDAQN
jgi:Lon protease-like protein